MPSPRLPQILPLAGVLLLTSPSVRGATADTPDAGPPWRGTSLTEYLQRAQEANPDLQAFRERYEAAQQRVPQARSLPDPMLQVTHFVESVQTRTGPQEQVFMLGQRIPWFGKLRERETAASAEAEALWFASQARDLMLMREVSKAYFDYAFTERAIRLTRENLDLLSGLEPIVEERVRAGGDLNPLLRLKVETGKVGDKLRSLEEKRTEQSARLSALLALPGHTILPWPEWAEPELESIPEGHQLAMAMEQNNPELAMLRRQADSAVARSELARLEGYPDLTLGVNYIRIGDPLNPAVQDAGKDPWGVTLSVNLPLWRGRINAAKSEAGASRRAVEASLANRENQLRAELSAALSQLQDAQRRLGLYGTELLQLARQSLEITRTSYEAGKAGILEVIDSERSLLELETLYWRAAADTWQARVLLQTLVNQPLQGGYAE